MKKRKNRALRFRYYVFFIMVFLSLAGCGKREPSSDGRATPTGGPAATEAPADAGTPAASDEGSLTGTNFPEPTEGVSEQGELEKRFIKMIEEMSLAEKVGQMFLARCPENAIEGIREYNVGGYVLFARDFDGETRRSMQEKTAAYQEASKVPLVLAVDEEGGAVVRVSKYAAFRDSAFLSPRELYAQGGMEKIVSDTQEKAELLTALGIHVNLAPVCDISRDKEAFMYMRSFGGSAEETAEYVRTVVGTAKEAGLGSVLKHFPGYGENADTHAGIVRDTRLYETYKENDFKPFAAGIEAGAGAVMVSHNIVQCMDPDMPASLSGEVHRILREELSFEGVILTDDLYMDAIQDFTGKEAAAVSAVLAGNDMLCCTDFDVQIPAVIAAVEDGQISEEQIEASVLRILKWKAELGILE